MNDKWLEMLNDTGDRIICHGPERSYTKSELRRKTSRLQAAIVKKGHSKWVLYHNDGFQFICAMFALLATGRTALLPPNRNRAVIESLLEPGVGFIGSHSDLAEHIDIEVTNDEKVEDDEIEVRVAGTGSWGQLIFCTSGSSGRPKMIVKSTDQLYREVEAFNRKWPPTPNTLFIPLVPHLHLYGLTFAFLFPLFTQARIYLPRHQGLLGVVESITMTDKDSIDRLVIVTSPSIGRQAKQIRVLAEPGSATGDDKPVPVSGVFCAGGKLTRANAGQIIELFDCPVTEIFGSTETGAVAAREHSKQRLNHKNPWRLFANTHATAIQNNDAERESNPTGELAVWGGHTGGSKKDPVMTGDEVNFVGPNEFELFGRSNQICKIEGKRVSLQYLMEMLDACELVRESAILPFEKNHKEVLLCGVVLSSRGKSNYQQFGKFSVDQLIREHLLRFLPPVLVPREIRYLDKTPRNELGKVSHQTLIELLVDQTPVCFPLIEDIKIDRDQAEFLLTIPMNLHFLRGHFESRPIVPGIVLLHWVHTFIHEHWKLPTDPAIVTRLRFSKPTAPGDNISLVLKRLGNSVEFLYLNEEKIKFSSGKIALLEETTDV